jgi:hypothetical protein
MRLSREFCRRREKQSDCDDPELFGYFLGFFFAFFFFGTEITSRSNLATRGLRLPTATKFCQRDLGVGVVIWTVDLCVLHLELDNETHTESTNSGLELRDSRGVS